MSHEDKQIQSDVGCDEPFKQDVFYCISYIIAKCKLRMLYCRLLKAIYFLGSLMQELFHKWLSLTRKLQSLLNYEACYILDKNEMAIFLGIIKGMIFWNTVQDSEGLYYVFTLSCSFKEIFVTSNSPSVTFFYERRLF